MLRDLDREVTLSRVIAVALAWGFAARCPPGGAREHLQEALLASGIGAEMALPAGCAACPDGQRRAPGPRRPERAF